LATYDDLLAEGPAAALAGFVAYECQAGEVAQRKAEGLRRWYGLDDDGVAFWAHHARVDIRHGAWARRALASVAGDGQRPAVRRAADAWWAFLDEREVVATTG
jgi:pyrroloquinoline quinone (PQQ) biosynthesis protein C